MSRIAETVTVDGQTYTPYTTPSVYTVKLAQRRKHSWGENGNYWEVTPVLEIARKMAQDAQEDYEAEQNTAGWYA